MIERFSRFSCAISDISRYWHKIATEEMKKYGLRGTHAIYLTTLYRYPEGLTAVGLCEHCGKDKADVSRMMNIMENLGLVEKEDNVKSQYRVRLRLTDAGREAAEQVAKRAAIAVEHGGSGISEENRRIFYETLETIASNLYELSEEGLPKE